MKHITSLPKNHIFVFGSNLRGRHGKGAAFIAAKFFGAMEGKGEGMAGTSYAIPTKDEFLRTLCLADIDQGIQQFLSYAAAHMELTFVVTPIGCGLAGYNYEQIAPMFRTISPNVVLPEEFTDILK